MDDKTKVEETTTVSTSAPQQVVKKVTEVSQPPIKTEHPQKAFNKKKVIFRSYQVIWYILVVLEVFLAFRFILKMIGANPNSGFVTLIYTITNPLTLPFTGIVKPITSGGNLIEWSTFIAALVYLILTYGIVELFKFLKPLTPQEVENEVDSK